MLSKKVNKIMALPHVALKTITLPKLVLVLVEEDGIPPPGSSRFDRTLTQRNSL